MYKGVMASGNVEVEIKIPLSKKIFEKIRRFLKKSAKFIGSSNEIDKYYNSPHRNFLAKKHPIEYLRIRTKNGSKSSCTYKFVHNNRKGQRIRSDEYETGIENSEQLEKIFNVLNFDNFLTIDKERKTYEVKHDFEVDMDKVKGLGYFIEIETLRTFGTSRKTFNRVCTFATKLGLDPAKMDKDGYVLLMMKKKGIFPYTN
jgi:adenylate cyclase class 2